ncbi:hypothetical protein AVEN_193643-1 [Araneus ventricosus]|uniref:Uncharacterized protein n=1 Tax=Araneus ventricosus TaxID=182803 RepID=A0A4Y2HEW3_ARAVE|nr:hypothetical protein AVEN_193643-1 [Araneus ventricosus]
MHNEKKTRRDIRDMPVAGRYETGYSTAFWGEGNGWFHLISQIEPAEVSFSFCTFNEVRLVCQMLHDFIHVSPSTLSTGGNPVQGVSYRTVVYLRGKLSRVQSWVDFMFYRVHALSAASFG